MNNEIKKLYNNIPEKYPTKIDICELYNVFIIILENCNSI